jgi:hypothetical protein
MQIIKLLALVPLIAIIVGAIFLNRVTPYILGMPFLLFWLVLWTVLTSLVMWIIYAADPDRKEEYPQ